MGTGMSTSLQRREIYIYFFFFPFDLDHCRVSMTRENYDGFWVLTIPACQKAFHSVTVSLCRPQNQLQLESLCKMYRRLIEKKHVSKNSLCFGLCKV